jgi:hypothetical protein
MVSEDSTSRVMVLPVTDKHVSDWLRVGGGEAGSTTTYGS